MAATNPLAVPAETYAARIIAAQLNIGAKLDIQRIADDSGLTTGEVIALATKLNAKRAQPKPQPKSQRAPVSLAPAPEPAAAVTVQSGYTLPGELLSHDNPKVRRLAEKARDAIEACVLAVAEDKGRAELRAKRDKLRAQLAKVEAELKGSEPHAPLAPCPHCSRTFHGQQGVNIHIARTHGEAQP